MRGRRILPPAPHALFAWPPLPAMRSWTLGNVLVDGFPRTYRAILKVPVEPAVASTQMDEETPWSIPPWSPVRCLAEQQHVQRSWPVRTRRSTRGSLRRRRARINPEEISSWESPPKRRPASLRQAGTGGSSDGFVSRPLMRSPVFTSGWGMTSDEWRHFLGASLNRRSTALAARVNDERGRQSL